MNPKRILIIDDEPDLVDLLKLRLERAGYEVRAAYDGKSGLALAVTLKPDLILLDVILPEMSGYSAILELKSLAETKPIPIIVMTAMGETQSIFSAEGVAGFVTKPFVEADLLSQIETTLRAPSL